MNTADKLPLPYAAPAGSNRRVRVAAWRRRLRRRSYELRVIGVACLMYIAYVQWRIISIPSSTLNPEITVHGLSTKRLQEDLATCAKLHTKPSDPIGLGRKRNARYIDGQKPTLIVNATVWVGEPVNGAGEEYSWIKADVFLEYGLIQRVDSRIDLLDLPSNTLVYNAAGRPLTSGIIDMHSHVGVHSLPTIHSNDDTSELSSNITPFVRSIDGIQPTDHQIQVIKSGGVTTSLVLPGSSNNIGGEAYVIKHAVGRADGRNETSIADMLADPDRTWRYMKMACGENAKRVHGKVGERGPVSRLGESWEFRQAFEHAANLMRSQDDWCAATSLELDRVKTYLPAELKWEALIAVLRGQVHVHTHCYMIKDLEAFVNHSNEFRFPIRAFHHAHQAYLVPEVLKRAWGDDLPAAALFADNMWYKAEAHIGSEHAGKYLSDNGLVPIYVSDNPVLNAQHLVFEAAKAYRYGLPYHAALASVMSAPAETLGLGQRLGKVKPGFDADLVVWDDDPLRVGATPVQVWVDGTAQYENPVELRKPFKETLIPNNRLADVVETPVPVSADIVFTGISKVLTSSLYGTIDDGETVTVAVSSGKITCVGRCVRELDAVAAVNGSVVHIENGYLMPAFTAFGSTLGLNEIDSEGVTDNGADGTVFSRGVDGLALNTTKLQVARRYGVTRAISAPKSTMGGTHHGTSAGFLTAATTTLEKGTVFNRDVALHYTLDLSVKGVGNTPSMSSAIGELRDKLLRAVESPKASPLMSLRYSEQSFLQKVVAGEMALAITVHSADTISSLLDVKASVDDAISISGRDVKLRLVIIGGAEAHLVARNLAEAQVGVVLAPMQSYAVSWDRRRALPGAPLTNMTTMDVLVDSGVVTAIGLEEDWVVRDLGLLAGIAYRNSEGRLDEERAVDLISRNVYKMLDLEEPVWNDHFVIYEGSPFETDSRIRVVGDGIGQALVS